MVFRAGDADAEAGAAFDAAREVDFFPQRFCCRFFCLPVFCIFYIFGGIEVPRRLIEMIY